MSPKDPGYEAQVEKVEQAYEAWSGVPIFIKEKTTHGWRLIAVAILVIGAAITLAAYHLTGGEPAGNQGIERSEWIAIFGALATVASCWAFIRWRRKK